MVLEIQVFRLMYMDLHCLTGLLLLYTYIGTDIQTISLIRLFQAPKQCTLEYNAPYIISVIKNN